MNEPIESSDALRWVDEQIKKIPVPDLKPVDVAAVVGCPQLRAFRLPLPLLLAPMAVGVLAAVELVSLELGWAIPADTLWSVVADFVATGPLGLAGTGERIIWLLGLALAGAGLTGTIMAAVADM
jgi:hypothetical protein